MYMHMHMYMYMYMYMYMNMNECTTMCKQHQTTSTMSTYDQISFG